MSYNQSRPDRSGNQYRRSGRSTGYHEQQQQPHPSFPAGAAVAVTASSTNVDPSLSSKRSSVKNAQGWHQPRVNHSVPNDHNVPSVQSRSQVAGASHHEHDSYHTPGKVMYRQRSSGPSNRRLSNMVVDDRWAKTQGSHPAGYEGFRPGGVLRNPPMQGPIMSNVAPMGGIVGRNTLDLERWQRGSNFQQKGLFSSPLTPMQVMHNAERTEQRKFKGILNKLIPQNFEKLLAQVKSVNIDNPVTLIGVVSQIFDKALMEPTFAAMYADLCFHLSGALPDFNWDGETITFKRLLLNKCQEEFERGVKEEEEASNVPEAEQTEEEDEEKRLEVRRRMLGNIRLIGELYKKRMLTEKIMHACIQKLLGYDQDPHEENIEALCKLMSTIGVMIDHHKAKVYLDAYFERMKMLSCKQGLSSRVRFMLIDAIDLRKNKWQERMKVEGLIPDKTDEKIGVTGGDNE